MRTLFQKTVLVTVASLLFSRFAQAVEPSAISKSDQEYWSQGPTRPFASMQVDFGYIYLRLHLAVGYGKPYHQWISAELLPSVTNGGTGIYGGVRGAVLPWFELRAGARHFIDFNRSFLVQKESYNRFDIDDRSLPAGAQYNTLETELNLQVRTLFGVLSSQSTVSYVLSVPSGENVFEDGLRVVITPPWLLREKLAYRLRIKFVQVGPVAEVLYNPGRDLVVVRAGVSIAAILSPHLEVLANFVPVVYSRDSLGFAGGDFATIGLRYRVATGSGGTETWASFLRQ